MCPDLNPIDIKKSSQDVSVELRGITRTIPTPPPVEAVRSAASTINAGEYVSIVGPSGSDKSTLLHPLGLLDQPTAGTHIMVAPRAGMNDPIVLTAWTKLLGLTTRDDGGIQSFYDRYAQSGPERGVACLVQVDEAADQ